MICVVSGAYVFTAIIGISVAVAKAPLTAATAAISSCFPTSVSPQTAASAEHDDYYNPTTSRVSAPRNKCVPVL